MHHPPLPRKLDEAGRSLTKLERPLHHYRIVNTL